LIVSHISFLSVERPRRRDRHGNESWDCGCCCDAIQGKVV
jgi:hypothetical protein